MNDMQQDNHPDNYPYNVLGHQRKLDRKEIERIMQQWTEIHKKALDMDKLEWASWYLKGDQK